MSILILGRGGYVARAFIDELEARGAFYAALSRSVVDYTCFPKLLDAIRSYKPELVINCAAFVTKPSVDLCQDHKSETLRGNLVFPETLVNACGLTHTPLLHVSTGCLYNDPPEVQTWFKESDPPMLTFDSGAGFYVGSKELAEQVVRGYESAYICRIRLPFDRYDHERNYLSKLLTYPKIFDCLNSISHRGDFVKACLDLWDLRAPWGTYHVTNTGAMQASEICGLLQAAGWRDEFEYWNQEEFLKQIARTPKSNATLSNKKLTDTGVKIRHVNEAIRESIRNWEPPTQGL